MAKLGRKPIAEGGKTSPREIFCNFVRDGKVVEFQVDGTSASSDSNEDVLDLAREQILERLSIEPEIIVGPYYKRKAVLAAGSKPAPKKARPELAPEEIVFSKDQATGVLKEYNVTVKMIENHPDIGFAFFKDPIDPAKRKVQPKNQLVYLSEVQNIVKV